MNNFQPRIPEPLKRRKWYTPSLNQAQEDLFKGRPEEFLELLIGEEAICAFMQRDEYDRVAGLLRRAYPHLNHERR